MNTMKKLFLMVALMATVFSSCTKDKENEFENLSQQMLGKWMLTQFDGKTLTTNEKVVYTFESDTIGYVSASKVDYSETQPKWTYRAKSFITVNGNKISMYGNLNKTTSFVAELEVKSISETEIVAEMEYTVSHNGETLYDSKGTTFWTRVSDDYSSDILGTWEGRVTSGEGSEFDDGEPHRWEYFDDGTYIYYVLDADSNWTPNASEMTEYFVDGTLLCTRWKNVGDDEGEHREWWEIASIVDGVMNWTAFRQREDGTTYTATFQMTKVQ
jgi:hypothetical protein